MKRSTLTLYLITALFASFLILQGAFSGQNDSVSVMATVLDAPPQGTIVINNGDAYTTSISVNLTLSAWDVGSEVTEMQFSNDGVTWSAPEAYSSTKAWTLSTGYGDKTVYARFRDTIGNWSETISDDITFSSLVTTIVNYSYDDLNRLENVAHSGRSTSYEYDEVGNINNRTTE